MQLALLWLPFAKVVIDAVDRKKKDLVGNALAAPFAKVCNDCSWQIFPALFKRAYWMQLTKEKKPRREIICSFLKGVLNEVNQLALQIFDSFEKNLLKIVGTPLATFCKGCKAWMQLADKK